ncbi:hypothetical protein BGX38DRAFT_1210425 [Terfezia claveryi]|nr:hypothetical protein BGX38DRAFT_1210425 [Terfezia claveryi]
MAAPVTAYPNSDLHSLPIHSRPTSTPSPTEQQATEQQLVGTVYNAPSYGSFPPQQNAANPPPPHGSSCRSPDVPNAPPTHHQQNLLHPSSARNRRRSGPNETLISLSSAASKIGPQRTTKNVQKLKILPSPDQPDEESGREVYSQVTRIKDTTARRDAERLGKAERAHLPRVTAYCTANAYNMDGLMRYFKARTMTRGAQPRQFDECIYTPYSYRPVQETREGLHFGGGGEEVRESLIDLRDSERPASIQTEPINEAWRGESMVIPERDINSDEDDRRSVLSLVKDQPTHQSEVFLFNYGVVVIWGMTVTEEKRFLKEIARFETEKLSDDDVQVENFNYYITNSYQPRIYNDFITLKDGRNYMVKVAISHAIAQSVKISLFEDLVENTIEETKGIPQEIATTGKVRMGRRTIMMHIGELFILRININLQGSVLDSPELMWSEPELEPLYAAARSYLEINQRVSLLNQRLDVIGDLLQMLKEQLSHAHGEYLEWIVIILIAAEIFVGLINIAVDILAEGNE